MYCMQGLIVFCMQGLLVNVTAEAPKTHGGLKAGGGRFGILRLMFLPASSDLNYVYMYVCSKFEIYFKICFKVLVYTNPISDHLRKSFPSIKQNCPKKKTQTHISLYDYIFLNYILNYNLS